MTLKIPRLPYGGDKLFGFLFLAVLLVPLAFSVFNYESFEIIKYALLWILLGGAVIAAGGRAYSRIEPGTLKRGFFVILGMFWLWVGVASLLAWDKNYSFFGFYPRFTNGFLFYTLWTILLLLLGLLVYGQVRFLLKVLVLCGGLMAVWGILQSVGFGYYAGPVVDFFNRSAPSFLGNPDFTSMFVASLVPLSLWFFYQGKGLRIKLYYGIILLLQLWALVIFASRGGLLALGVGLFGMLVLSAVLCRREKRWLGLLLGVACLGLLFSAGFWNLVRPGSVASTVSFSDVNIQYRLGVWKLAAQSVIKRPWFGVGLGNFQLMFERDRTTSIVAEGFFDDAHNLPLELAVTGGLPLAIFFYGLLGWAIYKALRRLYLEANAEYAALLGGLIAWLTASLFTPVDIACYLLLAVFIAACLVRPEPEPELATVRPARRMSKIVWSAIGTIMIIFGMLFLAAETLFFAGAKADIAGDFSRSYNEVALAARINPFNRLYYVFLTGAAIRSGRPLSAINGLFDKLNSMNTGRAYSYVEAANLYYLLLYRTHDPVYQKKIIDDLNTALSMDHFSANTYLLLSEYDLVFGNLPGAQAATETGLKIDPANFGAWMLLAKIYQLQGSRESLVQTLKKAITIQSDNPQLVQLERAAERNPDLQSVPLELNFSLGQLD